jgi:hypothetical protein
MKEKYWLGLLALMVVVVYLIDTHFQLSNGEVCLVTLPLLLILVVGYIDSMNK